MKKYYVVQKRKHLINNIKKMFFRKCVTKNGVKKVEIFKWIKWYIYIILLTSAT